MATKFRMANCIVLHSLEMAEHVDNIFGEIDFVISQMMECSVLK